MIFELLVLGKILSGNAAGRASNVFENRSQIDPQMQRDWQCSPLKEVDDAKRFRRTPFSADDTGVVLEVGNFRFIPLVTERLKLAARLEVNFYEPEGSLSVKGDVSDFDNRLKTLFDALRVPNEGELGTFQYHRDFYCLLSDDKLIWEVSVKRTRLLRTIEGKESLARIRVEILPTADIYANTSLIGILVH
jgi:hypothetical protein